MVRQQKPLVVGGGGGMIGTTVERGGGRVARFDERVIRCALTASICKPDS